MDTAGMGAPHSRVTYEDYKRLPETLERYELMDGELCLSPAPTTTHQAIVQNIEFLLVQHVRVTSGGRVLDSPVDVVLWRSGNRDVVQPDIVFVRSARLAIIEEAEIAGPPDLVVEVLSPGTAARDRGYKKALYEQSGVQEYWLVDPEARSVEVFRRGAAGFDSGTRHGVGDEFRSAVVDGLSVPVSEVFRL